MRFRSNNCVAIHLKNLRKAEKFYAGALGFKLVKKTKDQLEFDTGNFRLYINKSKKHKAPVPSFDVQDLAKARKFLKKNGCKIVKDWDGALYFKDPFGITYDIIEKKTA